MWTERVGYTRLVNANGQSLRCRCNDAWNNWEFHYMSSLRSNLITSKVTLPLGYLMDFVLLGLMTQKPNVRTSWFIPWIAADGTKDNSWPFRTGTYTIISFKNSQVYIDMITALCIAMRRHVIKLISCII